MALPRGAVGWSAVCDCGISCSYSLTFLLYQTKRKNPLVYKGLINRLPYAYLSEPSLQFDFVILVAGFRSRQSQHDHLYKVPFSVPSLHVYGDTDKVIQKGTVNLEIFVRISF